MQISTESAPFTFDSRNGFDLVALRENNTNTHTRERKTIVYAYAVRKAGEIVWQCDAMVDPAADAAAWKSASEYFDRVAA